MAYVYYDLALHMALPMRVLRYELSSNSYFNADVVPVYYQAVFAHDVNTGDCGLFYDCRKQRHSWWSIFIGHGV